MDYSNYNKDTAQALVEYAKLCRTPEDDGYMAFWCAIIFDLTADDSLRLIKAIRKRL